MTSTLIHLQKKTKIVATIGPATESTEQLEKLLKAGLNVIRMNFSHGDFAEHQRKLDNGRAASKKTGIPVAFLQDLSGPKIRTGRFYNDDAKRVTLKAGQKLVLTTDSKVEGTEDKVYINYEKLPKEAKKGETVLIDDGKIRLTITDIKGNEVICKVIVGGEVKGKRGVNLPESDLSISALTDKDKKDLDFAVKNNVDYVAFSFVRRKSEAEELRTILNKRGLKHTKIIAKIETPQAVKNFDEILSVVDGIMVARGDLAVEIPAEEVPLAQKMMIEKCNQAGKPVITATQMLESMIKSPVPTRAEVSDVANAILDGTDAIMLSEETTLGAYPIECVELMSRIALKVEGDPLHRELNHESDKISVLDVNHSTADSATRTAHIVGAKYIVALTEYGSSASFVSRHRAGASILAMTPNQKTYNQMCLYYGVHPILMKRCSHFDSALKASRDYLVKNKCAKKGDKVVVVSGVPFSKTEETNLVVVETI